MSIDEDKGTDDLNQTDAMAQGGARHDSGVRPPAVAMAVAVLILGSVAAYFIVKQPAVSSIAGIFQPASSAAIDKGTSTGITGDPDHGASLATQQCSGCHALSGRLIGPSWREVAARYSDGKPQETCLPQLVSAVTHPAPGWPGYPRGPAQSLSLEDKQNLAAFILSKKPSGASK